MLKVRHAVADARLHVARKTKALDEWDPPIPVYDTTGPYTDPDARVRQWLGQNAKAA